MSTKHILLSNLSVYREIAEEAFDEMEAELKLYRRPKPDGTGWINTFDPKRKSFKAALVGLTFTAAWLEASLHVRIVQRFSKTKAEEYDTRSYEEKLQLLGLLDDNLKQQIADFRRARREVLHEKASSNSKKMLVAQSEASKAKALLSEIAQRLEI